MSASYKNDKNHRCAICNYVAFDRDILMDDPYERGFHYHQESDEFLCSRCQEQIYDALSEFEVPDEDEMPLEALEKLTDADLARSGGEPLADEEASPEPPEGLLEHTVGDGSSTEASRE